MLTESASSKLASTATTENGEYTTKSGTEATTEVSTPKTTPPTEQPDRLFRLVGRGGEDVAEGDLGLLLYRGGTVCDDEFDHTDARVICRELGYTNASLSTRWISGGAALDQFESYRYNIKLTNVRCNFDLQSWESCTYNTRHDCTHHEDVVLKCDTGKQSTSLS